MNFKRIFGAVIAFALVVAVSFGVQVDSASAATNTSLNELSQGGTLVADAPAYRRFEYNTKYYLSKDTQLTITDTPQRLVTMVFQNESPDYESLEKVRYAQDGFSMLLPANDRGRKIKEFNPQNSQITVNNISDSDNSRVYFTFL
jgi:hypothetical protein